MLPMPMILVAVAVTKKTKNLLYYMLAVVLFFVAYLFTYYQSYRSNYSWSWQYGYEQAVSYIKENYDEYDNVIVNKKYGEPHEFVLYYWPWNPREYREDANLKRYYQSNWYWVDRFDKFYFVNDWEVPKFGSIFVTESGETLSCHTKKCLLVTSPSNRPLGWTNVETIKFLNGDIAFEIYENKDTGN